MIIHLRRFSYGERETEGRLVIGNEMFATIEQPWTPNPNGSKGGKPFHSCIPDGIYNLAPWVRANGTAVFIMSNASKGVYKLPKHHRPGHGRDLCLFHAANFSSEVEGCIAPGLQREFKHNKATGDVEPCVVPSKAAMQRMRALLGRREHVLTITSDAGAVDK